MKTATIRELRDDFGRLSKWLEKGERIQLLKRGKPFARVIPEAGSRYLLGCMVGTAKVPDDIDEPADVQWEAMK